MKEIFKSVYSGVIRLTETLVSILVVLIFNKFGINKHIRALRKEEKKRPISILSGGPSAREVLSDRRDLLDNTDLLVLNNFANTEAFFSLKPGYYVLLDPAYFDAQFVNKGLEEKTVGTSNCTQESLLVDNLKKVDWPMKLFMPVNKMGKKIVGCEINNPYIEIVQYHATRIMGFDWFQNWMYRHNQGIPTSRNVIIPAMILMANIGFSKQYLYGCEFSWTKTMDVDPDNGMMFFNDRHFYSKEEIRYFGKGGYKWWLKAIAEMLNGTDQVAKYAESIGVDIINRTRGSFIDSFVYEKLDNV